MVIDGLFSTIVSLIKHRVSVGKNLRVTYGTRYHNIPSLLFIFVHSVVLVERVIIVTLHEKIPTFCAHKRGYPRRTATGEMSDFFPNTKASIFRRTFVDQ